MSEPTHRCPNCPQRVAYADGRIETHICGDPQAISAWIESHARANGLPWPPPTIAEQADQLAREEQEGSSDDR